MIESGQIPKTALVTGGAKRIGRYLVKRLIHEEYAVAIHYHKSAEAAETLLKEIHSEGGSACLVQGDLSQKETAERLIAQAQDHLGPLGILINNASIFEKETFQTLNPLHLDQHWEVNLKAPLFLAQKFAQNLPKNQKGLILNLLDSAIGQCSSDFVSYTLSKSALQTATSLLAQILAPDIRVNGIALGFVLPSEKQSQAHFDGLWQAGPLHLKTTLEEIAQAMMAFIAMPSVTGQILALDGGQHLLSRQK